jgi:hypothetical protein
MSTQSDQFGSASERKLALSSLIRRTMATAAEREQLRSKLVNVLIAALFLVTAISVAGYIGTPTATYSIAAGVVALVVYCVALFTNRALHRSGVASYILVIGGGLVVATQTLILALHSDPVRAGQASLFFIAIILETGLLFSPEATLLAAFAVTAFSGFAVLLGLSSAHTVSRSDAYTAVAFTLGLQALTALIAWLISQYIFETSLESQRAQELQFAQARLEALSIQTNEHQLLLEESVGEILRTITHAMTGDYAVHADIPESELTPVADSLNVLFQRYEAAAQSEQMRARMEGAALPIIETLSRISESGTPTPGSIPIMTNTPLDSVSYVAGQVQANMSNRLGRVQRLAGEVVSTLNHSQEPLTEIQDAVHEAQRIAGLLIATSDAVLSSTRAQLVSIFTARRMLSGLLPEEITRLPEHTQPHISTSELSGLAPDLGMGPTGYTGQFEVMPSMSADTSPAPGASEGEPVSDTVDEADIAPMTMPLPTVDPSGALPGESAGNDSGAANQDGAPAGASARLLTGSGELVPELIESWHLMSQVDTELGQIERLLGKLGSQIGVQSKQLRSVDANIAWFRSALEAVRSNAEQLQQIAGTASMPMPSGDSTIPPGAPSRPLGQVPGPRGPQWSHELADEAGSVAEAEQSLIGPENTGPSEESIHAPGSLRATDLLSFDDIDFTSLADVKSRQESTGSESMDN